VGTFQEAYFNGVYNPIYDATTARFSRYKDLQRRCLGSLDLHRARTMLCVGLGTGNEAAAALGTAPHLSLTGIDLSTSALAASRRKLRMMQRTADLRLMNAESLAFRDHSFDTVMCMHVLDFVDSAECAVGEVVRVLRPGGRFVATFPSRPEGTALGLALATDHVRSALRAGRHPLAVAAELVAKFTIGLLYVPLLARRGQRSFSQEQIRRLMGRLPVRRLHIQEERAYQDFIVAGERE
jgi:ubiquinone/menaquinone biosynthesis C-methylase UbiE